MRKNWYLLGLAIAIALVALTATAVADSYVCGDADGVGGIDIDDVVYLIAYIFSGGPAPDSSCCESDCAPIVADYDGNMYFTVEIGDQCWMAQNLKVTHYRNGDPIPNVTDPSEWESLSTGAYCDYDNDPTNVVTYGRLYNWHAVADARNIAPEGWHVATDDEWKQMEMHLGMSQAEAETIYWRGTDEGGKLKETGTTHWFAPNTGATNESGFTALPGGYRDPSGTFLSASAKFWSSTLYASDYAWGRTLSYQDSRAYRYGYPKRYGFSVRCVRD